MKNLLIAAALLGSAIPALAETSVSINIGQPGFYGHIDIGDFRRPPVVSAQPVIIERGPRYVAEPVYLRVPPGHMKNWRKHCAHYDACGQRVYFVRDEWYNNTYAPRYREREAPVRHVMADRREDRREVRQEVRQEMRYDDRHDDRGGNEHGNGKHKDKDHGHGNGHGKHKD